MEEKIEKLVKALDMVPHPEGGFFKETYRSEGTISKEALPLSFNGDRNYATAIYFLLTSSNFSAFHRIAQDEIWHHYEGAPLFVHVIHPNGDYERFSLGKDISAGERPQFTVYAGCWFGSSVALDNAYSLVGCTVSPGFDFNDFELAKRAELTALYPQHEAIISKLTRS